MWYVALDVHGETTSISVRSARGVVVRRDVVATTRVELRKALTRVRGRTRIVCEAGPMARWIRDTLETRMREVIVCDRRRSRLAASKSDRVDADKLSELFWKNELHPVFVPRGEQVVLRGLARHYTRMLRERTRVIIRLRALFLESGIRVSSPRKEPDKVPIHRLRDQAAKYVAQAYLTQLATATELLTAARTEMIACARRFSAFELLQTVPHVGEIRSAQLIAIIADPGRFKSRRKFWSYGGVGVIQRTSAEHRVANGVVIREERVRGVRLSKACQPMFKKILRDVALYASLGRGVFRNSYDAFIARGMRASLARVALARKIATIILAVWRSGVPFDASRVNVKSLSISG